MDMEDKVPEEQGLAQESAEALVANAADELAAKLGKGTRVVIMASRGGPGTWGYCWSLRGELFGVLGLLTHAGRKVSEWISYRL